MEEETTAPQLERQNAVLNLKDAIEKDQKITLELSRDLLEEMVQAWLEKNAASIIQNSVYINKKRKL